MNQPRRLGSEDSKVRAAFVEAAKEILSEEGEHGLTARAVAARAGCKTQLLYYYFETMDDLLLAVVRSVNEKRLSGFVEALVADQPLESLWTLVSETQAASLANSLVAVAHKRDRVREEILSSARQFRKLQADAVRKLLDEQGGLDPAFPVEGVVMIAASLARNLANETALDFTDGHEEALAIVRHFLAQYRAPKRKRSRKAPTAD